MGATVDDVGHGYGQYLGVWAADVFVEWLAECIGPSLGGGEGHGEHGIGTEFCLSGGAIEREHGGVHAHLIGCIATEEFGQNFGLDVFDRLLHALAEVTFLYAVA